MKTDTDTKDLFEHLPHRPPMVWVSKVLEFAEEKDVFYGVCSVNLDHKSLLFDENGSLRGSAAIELTAQAYGFARACYHRANNIHDNPKKTFLTGVRHCETFFEGLNIDDEKELRIEFHTTKRLPPLTFVEGTVLGKENTLYGRVELQIYVV